MRIPRAFRANIKAKWLFCTNLLILTLGLIIISTQVQASKRLFGFFVDKSQKNSYWAGKGSIILKSGDSETLKCRATYFLSDTGTNLKQNLRCASVSYDIVAKSQYNVEGNNVTGEWAETRFNIKGNVSGKSKGNKLNLSVKGQHVNANMSIVVKRCSKIIKIVPIESVVTLISMKFARKC